MRTYVLLTKVAKSIKYSLDKIKKENTIRGQKMEYDESLSAPFDY